MNRAVWREALRLMDLHDPFVLATVVEARGSVPGKLGAMMLARSDGSFVGTVGGAGLEEKVKLLARETFARRRGGLQHFDLMGWKPGGIPSRCGGSVEIALQYVPARPNVLLWGGGHVAKAVAQSLQWLDYDHSVADDRPEYVAPDRFPGARHRWVVEPSRLVDRIRESEERFTHAYLLGYDAGKDEEVAATLLTHLDLPVGLMASATKRELTLRGLRARHLPEEALSRFHSPVGLPLGGETPEELAVGIVAEIVQWFHPTPVDAEGEEVTYGEEGPREAPHQRV